MADGTASRPRRRLSRGRLVTVGVAAGVALIGATMWWRHLDDQHRNPNDVSAIVVHGALAGPISAYRGGPHPDAFARLPDRLPSSDGSCAGFDELNTPLELVFNDGYHGFYGCNQGRGGISGANDFKPLPEPLRPVWCGVIDKPVDCLTSPPQSSERREARPILLLLRGAVIM